jgi:hypothetical protein
MNRQDAKTPRKQKRNQTTFTGGARMLARQIELMLVSVFVLSGLSLAPWRLGSSTVVGVLAVNLP